MEFGIEKETKTAKSDCVESDVSPSTPEVQEEEQGQNMEIDEITTADQNVETNREHPRIRRSTRNRLRPDYYLEQSSVAQNDPELATVKQALESPQKARWKEAMETEMHSLQSNNVWELVELPEGRKAVGSRWVFKVKRNEHGKVERYKARLVAQGFTRVKGADYDETFSPVARLESLRTLVAVGLQLYQVDITTAFLNGVLQEEVYIEPAGRIYE